MWAYTNNILINGEDFDLREEYFKLLEPIDYYLFYYVQYQSWTCEQDIISKCRMYSNTFFLNISDGLIAERLLSLSKRELLTRKFVQTDREDPPQTINYQSFGMITVAGQSGVQ